MATRKTSRSSEEWMYLNAAGQWHSCPGPMQAHSDRVIKPKQYTPQELEEALENLHEIARLDAMINLGGLMTVSRGSYTAYIHNADAALRAERRRLAALIPDIIVMPDEPVGKTEDKLIG